jgi:N-acetylglucosamine-6-phosphate deacetylase
MMSEATTHHNTMPLQLLNVSVLGYQGLHYIWINRQGAIETISPMNMIHKRIPPTDLQVLDVAGAMVSLGGVDLQINGGLGLAFPDLGPDNDDQLPKICQFLWEQGVDGFLPTLVTTSVEKIHRSLATLAAFISQQQSTQPTNQAKILGVHLEGPFLNPQKRGAHPAEYLLPLTIKNVKRVLADYAGIVKVITLAPELDPSGAVVAYLSSLGITISLGHSQATAAQAQQAFSYGAGMVTHAFNAMPVLHHREPGLLGASLLHPNVWCGFIADGEHVCPMMLNLLLRTHQTPQTGLFLVSDALAPMGLADGVYPWDSRHIEVKSGTCRLADGTLAGTTLPLLVGVQNLVKWEICPVETAIALATEAPRHAIGLPAMGIGQPASQLLRWHFDSTTRELQWQRLLS